MKILIHYRHFPVAMGRFFHWAFQDLGHEVYSVGPYSHGTIPWGDYSFPEHAFPPDANTQEGNVPLQHVLDNIPFKPDMVFQAGDVTYLTGKVKGVINATLATDPHAVNYTMRRLYSDIFFNMQKFYSEKNDVWIPYAYYPGIHRNLGKKDMKYDVVFCGLQYEHRREALSKMEEKGLRVFNALGVIYEKYVDVYNEGKIAFNWSSKQDLPARFWEGLAMGRLVLTSRVPDLKEIDMEEDVDYVAFSSVEEAVEKAVYYANHEDERIKIALSGQRKVNEPHTYLKRAVKIIKHL